jgi:lipoprotein-anchoring transpeptidase ErfK/SrfK
MWRSNWPLRTAGKYTVTATAKNSAGKAFTKTSTFRTLRPARTARVATLLGNQAYGVGIPIMLTFNHPVKYKAAVERAISITTSKPVVGAWYWDGNKALDFRPRTYWPQHTQVKFVAHLAGLQVAPGVYGSNNLSQSFHVGASLIAVVSTRTHYAKIYYKNKLFGNWPVSTGMPGDDTANGTYLTIEKANPTLMSGPGYTNDPVPYAVRFTWSGNYMHDAYWSVAQQGYTNVSHGCVNMSPAHATVYYNLAVPGDPVTVTGSPVAGYWGDGWTEWFLSWQHLVAGSATHEAVQAGPSGSKFVPANTVPALTHIGVVHGSKPGNYLAG